MFRIAFFLAGSICILGCKTSSEKKPRLPYYNEPTFTPVFIIDPQEAKDSITHSIPDFSLVNQDSTVIKGQDLEGKIHVANFIFTSCGSICPVMIRHMKIISDSFLFDPSVMFLSFSVTPWIDKPSVLKKYKQRNAIENKEWHFLTGSKHDVYTLARQSYFAEEDLGYSKDSTEFLHTEHFILVDKTRRIRGIYNGTLLLEIQQLIEDIGSLQEEN